MENTNGNSALNNSRESVNNNTSKYKYLGNTKTKVWDLKRSYRSI
jgi:hypothetical protein